jgi:hypothetical protein
MATTREVLDRTLPMMALAESADAATPGAAGLAYQAAELAVHVLMMEVDGADPWDDAVRYRRTSEILGIDPGEHDLAFMHRVRLRDFYANAAPVMTASGRAWGPPLEVPSPDDCRRCVLMARRIVDAVHARFGEPRR